MSSRWPASKWKCVDNFDHCDSALSLLRRARRRKATVAACRARVVRPCRGLVQRACRIANRGGDALRVVACAALEHGRERVDESGLPGACSKIDALPDQGRRQFIPRPCGYSSAGVRQGLCGQPQCFGIGMKIHLLAERDACVQGVALLRLARPVGGIQIQKVLPVFAPCELGQVGVAPQFRRQRIRPGGEKFSGFRILHVLDAPLQRGQFQVGKQRITLQP